MTTRLPRAFWNGEPCEARYVKVRVPAHDPERHPPQAWWAGLGLTEAMMATLRKMGVKPTPPVDIQGQVVQAVEVEYGGARFLLYDDDGSGTWKVTGGMGSPRCGHRDLPLDSEEIP